MYERRRLASPLNLPDPKGIINGHQTCFVFWRSFMTTRGENVGRRRFVTSPFLLSIHLNSRSTAYLLLLPSPHCFSNNYSHSSAVASLCCRHYFCCWPGSDGPPRPKRLSRGNALLSTPGDLGNTRTNDINRDHVERGRTGRMLCRSQTLSAMNGRLRAASRRGRTPFPE